ncbi:MAG: glycosyltransferase family 2 protein [Rikenellaceae bacterium]|nr:glycosyltransferase family 2 protein [Rikenellaceae bacterium]
MERKKISAVLITYNEEINIERTLESLDFVDEIVILDSYSTDRTVAIASKYTNKIYYRKFDDFSSQRNYSLDLATNEWVIVVDADEVVTNELKDEIRALLRVIDSKSVYSIERNNIFMGRRLKHGGVNNDYVVRIFPKTIRYKNKVHEIPSTGDKSVKILKNSMEHHTYKNYRHTLEKYDHYTTLHAENMFRKEYKITHWKLFIKPSFRFFRHYVLKMGFLDGRQGLVFAYLSAWGVFDKLVKTWRMQNGEQF